MLALQLRQADYPLYCLCRGTTPAAVREYPDFSALFENLRFWDLEEGLPVVLADIHEFLSRPIPLAVWKAWRSALAVWISGISNVIEILMLRVDRLSFGIFRYTAVGIEVAGAGGPRIR
jgi:hypothetical protein